MPTTPHGICLSDRIATLSQKQQLAVLVRKLMSLGSELVAKPNFKWELDVE